MNREAIERIKGYCCEVTQEQWDELVRVADEVKLAVAHSSRGEMVKPDKFARLSWNTALGVYPDKHDDQKQIPFPDFLAKLRGEERWDPKAGEMVDTSVVGEIWNPREFIAKRNSLFVCWVDEGSVETHPFTHCRPIRPTITRTEAEQLLKKRIID
jgi:hypothetical protein